MANIVASSFSLGFEISPIILTGAGLVSNIPGGMLPIVSLTEVANFVTGLLSGGDATDLDNFFAHFIPLPGSTLIDQVIGQYPFANQAVAANAVITQPLTISFKMICPARGEAGYATKLATMVALQATLAQHNVSGGTYTLVTPAAMWTNCVMKSMRDISANASAQVQTEWQLDFIQPLLTQQQANQSQNNLINHVSGGNQLTADGSGGLSWSGIMSTVGITPSLAGPSLIPAASALSGASVASPLGLIGQFG